MRGEGSGTGRGRGQEEGRGPGEEAAGGRRPGVGAGGSGGGGGEAEQLRQLAARLRQLSANLRREPPGADAAREARLAARELSALGRKLERGEFAHRRVRAEGAPAEARRPGRALVVGRGAASSSTPRALPTDVPMPKPDELRRLIEEGRLRLSPPYRRLVEQYLEAVSNE